MRICSKERGEKNMENIIIIAILVLLVFNGVRSSLKHFKGEGWIRGCRDKL